MAIYHPTSVTCPCGNTFPTHVARTINVRRAPDLRRKILGLELHRVVCPRCQTSMAVERPMAYVDPDRNAVFLVQPRGARVGYRRDSDRLDRATRRLPSRLSPARGRQAPVACGGARRHRVGFTRRADCQQGDDTRVAGAARCPPENVHVGLHGNFLCWPGVTSHPGSR